MEGEKRREVGKEIEGERIRERRRGIAEKEGAKE